MTKDARVDAYIAGAAAFARPILTRLRALVHATCPGVHETLKWGVPAFEYKGLLCLMAAFKAHCIFGFWKHELVMTGDSRADETTGSFGRITALAQLPTKRPFAVWMRRAMALNEANSTRASGKTRPKRPIPMHPALEAALAKDHKARATFEAFSPRRRRAYITWVADARTDATRRRRVATALARLAEGQPLHGRCPKR